MEGFNVNFMQKGEHKYNHSNWIQKTHMNIHLEHL